VTTRDELREAARTLQRLKVGAVGFVLNRVGLAKADPSFRASVEAVEKHLRAQNSNSARHAGRTSSIAQEAAKGRETLPQAVSARSLFEPELAAAAAAVARFSPPPVFKPVASPPGCLSSPMASAPVVEAVKRISVPLAVEAAAETPQDVPLARTAAPESPAPSAVVSEPVAETAEVDAPPANSVPGPISALNPSAPFVAAAKHFSSTVATKTAAPFSPRPVAQAASDPLPAVVEEPPVAAVAESVSASETEPSKDPEPEQAASRAPEMPWWLSDTPRNAEPARPPVLWQPAKVWTSRAPSAEDEALPGAPSANPATQQFQPSVEKSWEHVPPAQETPGVGAEAAPAAEEATANRTSRLSGLRNLLFVLGVKDSHSGEDGDEHYAGGRSSLDSRNERTIAGSFAGGSASVGGASPRLVTAPPEFLPPKPVVIEFDKAEARVGESSTRQDRRPAADRVEILPSKRGQYKKI
jgi:hypothetical protein